MAETKDKAVYVVVCEMRTPDGDGFTILQAFSDKKSAVEFARVKACTEHKSYLVQHEERNKAVQEDGELSDDPPHMWEDNGDVYIAYAFNPDSETHLDYEHGHASDYTVYRVRETPLA